MSIKQYLLKENNWKNIKKENYKIAILPWGATEAHNYHLPYGTDIFETEKIAESSAQKAWDRGTKVIVLPSIPFGVNTQQLDIKLTINLNPSSQFIILKDIIESLEHSQINKLIVFNGHGGNDFKQMVRELQKSTKILLTVLNWFNIGDNNEFFEESGDHAHEMETSMMMYLFPDLVLPLDEAGEGKAKTFKLSGYKEKWAWAPRQWTKVTKDTGVGNPKKAYAKKGNNYFDFIVNKISEFIVELDKTEQDEMYE